MKIKSLMLFNCLHKSNGLFSRVWDVTPPPPPNKKPHEKQLYAHLFKILGSALVNKNNKVWLNTAIHPFVCVWTLIKYQNLIADKGLSPLILQLHCTCIYKCT